MKVQQFNNNHTNDFPGIQLVSSIAKSNIDNYHPLIKY